MRLRVSRSDAPAVAAALAVVLSAAALAPPLLARGFPAGHDAPAHLTYVYLFDAALTQGQFPVRWIEWIRPGHSQPLFNFYQPGFYYAVQLLHGLGLPLLLSMKMTILLAWWGGGLFAYLYLRPLGAMPAALGALLFLRAPYLALDVFVRAAFPELLALACAPAVLWTLDRCLRQGRTIHALGLSAAIAAMLLCHLPTVLMFFPVLALYAGWLWLSDAANARAVAKAAIAAALGLAMASFYVAPALVELRFTRMRDLTSAYFDYRRHFVEPWQWFSPAWGFGASESGTADRMSFQVGIVHWLVLAASAVIATGALRRSARLAWLASGRWNHGGAATWLVWWLSVAAGSLFMTTQASAAIWEALTPLAFLQFPWRFLSVAALAIGLVAALVLSSIRSRAAQAAIVLCAAGALWWQTGGMLRPSHYFPRQWVYIDDPGWRYGPGARRLGFIEPGYYPSTVQRLPQDLVERWRITRGEGAVVARAVRDDRLVLDVTSDAGVELTLTSHGFPGWRVLIDGRPAPWRYTRDYGFMAVSVPPGRRRVEAAFGATTVRARADAISALSVTVWGAAVLAVAVAAVRKRRRSRLWDDATPARVPGAQRPPGTIASRVGARSRSSGEEQ